MRFVLKALFWIFVVGMFMPSEDVRASLPDLPARAPDAHDSRPAPSALASREAATDDASLCERSPHTCQAIAESRILGDITSAAVEIGVRQMMDSQTQSASNETAPDDQPQPAETP